jgi:hypothetical protein
MRYFRIHPALFVVAFAALISVVLFYATTSRGQSQSQSQSPGKTERAVSSAGDKSDSQASVDSHVKPTALVRERSTATSATAIFAPAAERNALLRTELNWLFGGKQQHGWNLYTSLIGQLLNTDHDSGSTEFAAALAAWQQNLGKEPSGVLDDTALYAMVSEWQGRRIKDRTPAAADKLLLAPISDFYDPTREADLRQVERETYAAYKRMIAAAVADKSLQLRSGADNQLAPDEKYLKIVSAFRSREYQDRLRRESPNAGSAGLAINSPHFTGRALDLYVGGDPVDTLDANRAIQVQTPVYQWLVRNAERFGFRPYYYEPWHWEYVR